MLREDRRGRDEERIRERAGACRRGRTEAGRAAPGPGSARALAADGSGAVAIIFAFALIPLVGIMGAAVDYSRASLGRAYLRTAVDSAGLAVARLPRNTPIADVQREAQAFVNANQANKDVGAVTVTAQKVGARLVFTATTSVAMTLFGVLRTEPLQVAASNEISWDIGKVEIALVLDNTGSMTQNNSPKLDNLKKAATSLVNKLEAAMTQEGQVKIGVVPFSMTVRLDPSYATQYWLAEHPNSPVNKQIFYHPDAAKSNPNRFTLLAQMGQSWAGCVESRPAPYDVQDTAPVQSAGTAEAGKTLFVPYFWPDEKDNDSDYPNSYLADISFQNDDWKRRQGYVEKYKSPPSSTSRGPNRGCGMEPILRLTKEFQKVRDKITAMTATGQTNVPMGLVWGWHLLAPHAPFADGVPYDTDNVTKYVILMTDGDNTFNRLDDNNNYSDYTGLGYIWQKRLGNSTDNPSASTRTDLMDGRLETLCNNLTRKPAAGDPKTSAAPDIQVYAIRVEVTSGTSDVLKNCASDASMYYDVAYSDNLTTVFDRIAEEITQLRLSK